MIAYAHALRHRFGSSFPVGRAAWAFGLALSVYSWRVAAQTAAVVTTSPAGEEAARHLQSQIDYPVVVRQSPRAAQPEALMEEARGTWEQDLVVVIDVGGALVRVLRPRDGTVASRSLDREAMSAPYAISLAAAELLEIVKNAPVAKAARLPPARSPSAPQPKLEVNPAASGGLLISVSANGDVRLFQPTIGADLCFTRYPEALWYGFGLHAAGLVGMTRTQTLLLPDGPDTRAEVTYSRDQIALRSMLGHRQGPGRALIFLDVGAAAIGVRSRDRLDREVQTVSRWTVYAGVGGELRYALAGGLFVGVQGGVAWLPQPQRFWSTPEGADQPVEAFREVALELRVQPVMLVWEPGS